MIQPREVQRPTNVPTSYERGPDWREDALCAQTGGDDHHPLDGDRAAAQRAKKICQACTVTAECLAWALDNDQRFGIWGGTTERERRNMRRERNRAKREAAS